MNQSGDPEIVVYFSEVSELKALLEETRSELIQRGIKQPSLTTTDGKTHVFDLVPENFRVTDHLGTQSHVRCKACSHEPALRYEFRVLTQDGSWMGPVGSTCLFTHVLGKSRAQTLGKKMQHHAVRESHNQRHRMLLSRLGNHYTYLSQLGLNWIHKPSMVKNFEVPRKLHGQFDQAVHGGIIEHELFEYLQQYVLSTPGLSTSAPKSSVPLPPASASAPPRLPAQRPSEPSVASFSGRPVNVPLEVFEFWKANQDLIQKVAPAGWQWKINERLRERHRRTIGEHELKMMLEMVGFARAKQSGVGKKNIPDDLYAFYLDNQREVRLHLLDRDWTRLQEEVKRLEQFSSVWCKDTLEKAKARMDLSGKFRPPGGRTPVEDGQLTLFWTHLQQEVERRYVQQWYPSTREWKMARAVVDGLLRHHGTRRLHGLAEKSGAVSDLLDLFFRYREDLHVHPVALKRLYSLMIRAGLIQEPLPLP